MKKEQDMKDNFALDREALRKTGQCFDVKKQQEKCLTRFDGYRVAQKNPCGASHAWKKH